MRKLIYGLGFFVVLATVSFMATRAQTTYNGDYAQNQLLWVENKLEQMTLEEKIGQLFMVAAYSNEGEEHKKEITDIIKKYNIGGLIFFKGNAEEQVRLTNHFQLMSKIPLLIAIDGEWGLSMRLKDTPKFPRQLTLGAIQNDQLIFEMGKEIARECKRIGVHLNLAPVVDVNNNPNNPVINDRSFGEDKENVARKAVAYMQGMEMNGVLACAKHFPGHGDTDKDSHHTLPVIRHSEERLKSLELYPFQEMIKHDVSSIMTAHLAIPALDDTPIKEPFTEATPTMPASLSKKITNYLLRSEMGYDGLIITDALNMKGVSGHFAPGEVDLKALLAGNDILLFPEDLGKALELISQAVKNGEILEDDLDQKVRKILKAKFRVGLEKFNPISTTNLLGDLNTTQVTLLKRKLISNALTVARNDKEVLPIVGLEQQQLASVALGSKTETIFQNTLDKYAKVQHFSIDKEAAHIDYNKLYDKVKYYSTVFVGVHNMSRYASKNHGMSQQMIEFIYKLQGETNVVLVLFGTPYALDKFPNVETAVVSYADEPMYQDLTAQMLFGAIPAKGKLPVGVPGSVYQYGTGVDLEGGIRLQYTIPEDSGLKSETLNKIDAVAERAVKNGATPGCQVLVAKDNKVIFHRTYGHHSYGRKKMVKEDDIYDLASITKIAASVTALMEMYENGKLDLEQTMGSLLPELKGTNKANIKVQDILTHQGRLISWIPFYAETLEDKIYDDIYNKAESETHTLKLADNMYMKETYVETMWKQLVDSDLRSKWGYKYSDLGYYMFHRAIEDYTLEPMENYLSHNYYEPLGMHRAGFNPLERFQKEEIIPTENDTKFRKQLLQGYVHDMGAAMLGGVCGHAGLFASANDLAIMMQMFLNGGIYGNRVYFEPSTIEKFTSKQNNGCRRGLGFDKPDMNRNNISPSCDDATASTFGHTGFTGTCAWADPEHNMIYIFLSNRINPSMNNKKLIEDNVRTEIQQLIYDAMKDPIVEDAQ